MDTEAKNLCIETDTPHLLKILTESLHSEPWTPVREYLANAHDACQGRTDPDICIFAEKGTIQIRDNGCGMTEEVIRRAFTCIGGHRAHGDGRPIGQFGLGVLSAFIIADRLVVETRSQDEPHGWRVQWGRREGYYTLTAIDRAEVGTHATLHVDSAHREMAFDSGIRSYVEKQLGLFTTPIRVGKERQPTNRHHRWLREQAADPRPRLMQAQEARDLFRTYCKTVPLIAAYGAFLPDVVRILLGIPVNEQNAESLAAHKVWLFCQGILVKGNIESFFPENLAFLVGLLDHPDFLLQIDRENLIRDRNFSELRGQIDEHAMNFLLLLAAHEPGTMEQVLQTH